jgi:thioredoxin 2
MNDVLTCPSCQAKNRAHATSHGAPHCAKCGSPLPWLVEARDDNFGSVVEESALPVLLDLWASWCPPCRMIAPTVEQAASRFAGRLKVAKLDVDQSPMTSERFNVRGIPTILILKNGKEVDRQVGALLGEPFFRWVEQALGEAKS